MQFTLEDALRQLRTWHDKETWLLVKGIKDTGEQLKPHWARCAEVSESSVLLRGDYPMDLSLQSAEFMYDDCCNLPEPAKSDFALFESILGIKSGRLTVSLQSSITGFPVPILDSSVNQLQH
jgi:hypothetical protein